ncbi:MAG TPA: class I SAM-dependent methyltransferase [Solirubrobacteraceae bacterium]|nr:class I SAM-dependent methyltransferase [Solirubrobacteraceae bacterium]
MGWALRGAGARDEGPALSLACPLCESASTPAFTAHDVNRGFSDEEFRYRRCGGCGVVFLENVPVNLADYYTAGYHHTPEASALEAAAQYEAYKLSFVTPVAASGRIIDIGPSYGAFPFLARRAGYAVTAIELDADCCRFIEEVVGVEAINSAEPHVALESLPAADVITLWHSIEHLADPWLTLEAATRRLRPGGALIVATPNPDGLQARLLAQRWAHVDAPRHLFLIPQPALAARGAALGLSLVAATARDIETRRCNRYGWQRAMAMLGSPDQGVLTGAVVDRLVRPLERRDGAASAYVAVLVKR